jgi:hypothetical protein
VDSTDDVDMNESISITFDENFSGIKNTIVGKVTGLDLKLKT